MIDKGKLLELYVASKLESIYKYSRPTIASGSTPVEKGDIKNPWFLIECKSWSTDSFSIKNDVWHKLKGEAAHDSYKDPIYITENKHGNKLASMDLEDWLRLVEELIELRKKCNEKGC